MVKPIDDEALTIYTDGSSYSGPRRGGVGILYVTVDESGHERVDEYPLPGYEGATNNQMELRACIDALTAIVTRRAPVDAANYKKIIIRTDSMYVAENIYNARFVWPSTGWMTRGGNPVLNAGLWKELVRAAGRAHRRVDFEWVKGHKKDLLNRAADRLAKQSANVQTGQHVSVVKVRRKRSSRSVEPGSVEMLGQRVTLRVITDEYLPVQNCNRYKYEVMSKASPFHGCVDVIYSDADLVLSAGHTYHVRVNTETLRPRVVKLFREIT
jgi:ribonuclease HI